MTKSVDIERFKRWARRINPNTSDEALEALIKQLKERAQQIKRRGKLVQ